jgi:hypothetical protein
MTKLVYADCPAGASGDMFLAACLDLGLPLDHLRTELARLHLAGYRLETFVEKKQHLAARRFVVHVEPQKEHRRFADIKELIDQSGLSPAVKEIGLAVFTRLAEAEARVHGTSPDDVHFHEVGAVDSIVDILGAAAAWEWLERPSLFVSPLPLGSGFVDTAHGRLPLPAPATLALLNGVPTYGGGVDRELVTPTGAALLTTLADGFGPRPAMTVEAAGLGAGGRDLPDRPNILRLTLGREEAPVQEERLTVGEANIDDMNPEFYPHVIQRLLGAGALDAWLTPIQMKKGRPAVTLHFLCRPADLDVLARLVLNETTTLGLRTRDVARRCLPREVKTVETPYGPAQVKVVARPNGRTEFIPEYEACRRIAEQHNLPLKTAYAAVLAACTGAGSL